jgi:DHA1 family tetracycline resistance protein-like MFS transporter
VEDAPQVSDLAHPKRKAALGFIFITALMDVISLGIMIPVLPNLVKSMVGGDTSTAVLWTTAFSLVWGVTSFFFSPILGMLSDRFGRRSVILISIFGLGIDYLFMAFAPTLWWLFLGRMIHGATAASFSTAGAYIADITPPEDRAKRFGMIGAAWGLGFILGPALGGLLSSEMLNGGVENLRLPFYVAAGMALLNWLYGLLVLPESLAPEKRLKRLDWRRASPLGSFRLLRGHHELLPLASVVFCFQLGHNVLSQTFALYTGYRFDWGPLEVGLILPVTGILGIFVQGWLVGRAVKALGERRTLLIGLVFGAAGFLVYGLAPSPLLFYAAIPIMSLSAFVMPSLQALMTRRVGASEQGQLQGATSGIMGITTVVGPLTYGPLLSWSTHQGTPVALSGTPVLVAAFILLVGLGLAIRAGRAARV